MKLLTTPIATSIFFILFSALDLYARAGGGGGGYSRSSYTSRNTSEEEAILFGIIFLGIVVFSVLKFRFILFHTFLLKRKSRKLLAKLCEIDPIWDEQNLKEVVINILSLYSQVIKSKEWETLKPYATDNGLKAFKNERVISCAELVLKSLSIIEVWDETDNTQDSFSVFLNRRARHDHSIELQEKTFINMLKRIINWILSKGRATDSSFSFVYPQVWHFVRINNHWEVDSISNGWNLTEIRKSLIMSEEIQM